LHDDREYQEKWDEDHAVFLHVVSITLEIGNLADARYKKIHTQ
jgi:hypothetical protein